MFDLFFKLCACLLLALCMFVACCFPQPFSENGWAAACLLRPGGLVLNRAVFYFRVGVRQSSCSHNDGGEQKQQSTRAAGALVLSEAGVSMETCRRRQ